MSRSSANPWPAFAEMLFMLFVTTLLASGVITTWAIRSEERLHGCRSVDTLLDGFEACTGETRVDRDQACKVSIGEDRLQFETRSSRLSRSSEEYGRLVAHCIVQVVEHAIDDPAVNATFDVVTIDGFTDCVGSPVDNVRLGAERGQLLYSYAVAEVAGETYARQADIMSRIAVRSFGKTRPRPDSPCSGNPNPAEKGMFADHPNDRRVEISFHSRLREE